MLFDTIRNQARGSAGGWNADMGFGIIDPVATATTLGV
jgi:hypothetical protein